MGEKMKISKLKSKHFTGYKWPRSTNISPGESIDVKESVRDLTICRILYVIFFMSQNSNAIIKCSVSFLFANISR